MSNEIQLSNNLTTIETEIKSYQNIAGQSIFEIGRRLKHVKENDLAHGEFGKWLENIGMHKQQAHRFMKIADEFQNSNSTLVLHLGIKALYQLATMPEEQRNHAIEHGVETKKGKKRIDEVTTTEIEKYKKQLKQRDEEKAQMQSQLEQARKSEQTAIKQLEDEQNKTPETKTEYKEVIPDNVKKKLDQIENNKKLLQQKEKENREIRKKLREQEEELRKQQDKANEQFIQDGLSDEEIISRQRVLAETNLLEIKEYTDEFLNKVSINTFRDAAIAKSSQRTKNMIYESAEEVIRWAESIKNKINTNNFVEDANFREEF